MDDTDLMTALAIHAPPAPDWFMPYAVKATQSWDAYCAKERERIAAWPWTYAQMVLAARPAQPPLPTIHDRFTINDSGQIVANCPPLCQHCGEFHWPRTESTPCRPPSKDQP